MAFAYSPKIVTDGLVFAVDAGNTKSYPGSGTTWKDLSGNGNDGTLTNGPTFDSGNGGNIVFDGGNDYVDVSNLRLITNDFDDKFTINVWVKTTTTSNYNRIVQFQHNVGLYLCSDGGFGVQSGGDNSGVCASGTFIRDGNWHHIVVTYDEGIGYTGYKDGQLVFDVSTIDTEPSDDINTVIGKGDQYFNGSLAAVSFYNKILTPEEVAQNYNALKGRFGL